MKRGRTDVQNIEYVETCKAIRRRMAEVIRSYNEERQLQALKNNNGLREHVKITGKLWQHLAKVGWSFHHLSQRELGDFSAAVWAKVTKKEAALS